MLIIAGIVYAVFGIVLLVAGLPIITVPVMIMSAGFLISGIVRWVNNGSFIS